MTRVMIMAGGSGGLVFLVLAVEDELRACGVVVFWLGMRRGLEAKLVPNAGIAMEWASVAGLRGKGVLTLLLAPFQLLRAALQVLAIILRQRPTVVLGMGGFVTGPGGVVTWLLRKPLVIHEQNSIAGMTNRLLAPLAQRVCAAFPGTFKRKDKLHTGNPVRREISELSAPAQRFAARGGPINLLVLGGSLGARALNVLVPAAVATKNTHPNKKHQTSSRHLDEARAAYERAGVC